MTSSAPEAGADPLAAVAGWPVEAAVIVIDRQAGPVAGTGPLGRSFPWASVTKPLTALATLVAVEEGVVHLDGEAGPPGATIRHLLAHASGLHPDTDTVLAPPGQRRIYSNRGFEVLADTVATAAGMPFGVYLREAVLDPLGMGRTSLCGSPASGAEGPAEDLALLAGEWIRPRLVDPATLAQARSVAFPGLAGVLPGYGRHAPNDWGLGVELRGDKRPHWTGRSNSPATFGHFGRAGSYLWVDPVAGLACVELADTPWGPWAVEAWPTLADAVVARWGAGAATRCAGNGPRPRTAQR